MSKNKQLLLLLSLVITYVSIASGNNPLIPNGFPKNTPKARTNKVSNSATNKTAQTNGTMEYTNAIMDMLEDPSWAQDKFKNGKAYSVSTEQAQLYIALAKEGERQRFWTIFWKVAIFGTVILGVIGYMVYLTIKKKKTR